MSMVMEERIYRQLIELVNIPSVTGSEGEKEITRFIYNTLAKEKYFKEHPNHLKTVPGPDGKRCSLVAMVRSASETAETVLCISHLDVVDVDVYGDLAKEAFDPEALQPLLKNYPLDEAAQKDLESGNWIFGRGVMDMKCGVALELDLLEELARNRNSFDVNIVVAAVFDEEGSNQGMISVVPFLEKLAKREELQYIAALNTEPTDAGMPGALEPGYFLSTMGKALVMVYVVGQPAHGGNYFSGISAAFIQNYINIELEAQPELIDASEGGVTIPPFVLNQQCRDRKNYSVSIPHLCVGYYNVFTVGKTPSEIIACFKEAAKRGTEKAIKALEKAYMELATTSYRGAAKKQKNIPVISYEELRNEVAHNFHGDFKKAEKKLMDKLQASGMDLREQGIRLVEWLLSLRKRKDPVIIIGFLPPYMPYRSSYGDSHLEQKLRLAAETTASYARKVFGRKILEYPAFGGLCDLSYVGCEMNDDELESLKANIPGWGTLYELPLESMKKLDMPIINLGPLGRDAHTWIERLERDYALEELPHLLRYFIKQLS